MLMICNGGSRPTHVRFNVWPRPPWVDTGLQLDKTMVLEVSNLVKTFMTTTDTCEFPHMSLDSAGPCLHEEETPRQDLGGICGVVVHKLDEVATHQPSTVAWD